MGIHNLSCTYTVHIHTIIKKIHIYTYHTRVYTYIYINISLDEEIPGSIYLLPQVACPAVVAGRGVDVYGALVVAALHVTSPHFPSTYRLRQRRYRALLLIYRALLK